MTPWLGPEVREWGGRPVARSIAEAQPRRRLSVTGRVVALVLHGEPFRALDARLDDGTGRLVVRWLGRSSVAGVTPDALLRVEGTIVLSHGALVVLNPLYDVQVSPPERRLKALPAGALPPQEVPMSLRPAPSRIPRQSVERR